MARRGWSSWPRRDCAAIPAIRTANDAGIPIIFFTTGLHPDYHANTDEVSKIEFDKMARIGEFIYATGWRLATLDHAPVRDRHGARMGKALAPLAR